MHIPRVAVFLLPLSVLLAPSAGAQVTMHSIMIGGPGSCSASGFCNPALLNDGVTPASATYLFTLDKGTATLTLTVTNTSPVSVGVPNPLLTDIFFNTPPAITALSLTNQTSTSGVAPSFTLTFDAALGTNPNPNGAGAFGAFNVALADTGNIQGAIANPNADTYVVPAAQLAVSPCTFTFSLTGNLTGLTAADFAAHLSVNPPGNTPSHAAAKFQAGGAAQASDFVNEGNGCPSLATTMVLGSSCGGTLAATPPIQGGFSTVTYTGATPNAPAMLLHSLAGGTPMNYFGCTMFLQTPMVTRLFTTDANGDYQHSYFIPTSHICGQQLVLQALVINPMKPKQFAEISNGLLVTVGS